MNSRNHNLVFRMFRASWPFFAMALVVLTELSLFAIAKAWRPALWLLLGSGVALMLVALFFRLGSHPSPTGFWALATVFWISGAIPALVKYLKLQWDPVTAVAASAAWGLGALVAFSLLIALACFILSKVSR